LKLQLQLFITIYGQQIIDVDYNIFAKDILYNRLEHPKNGCVVDYKREREKKREKNRHENLE